MKRLIYIILISALGASIACNSPEKSQYASIDAHGWLYGDTLRLEPVCHDSVMLAQPQLGDLDIVVRHTNAYEYSNLWLCISYAGVDTTITDTINVVLADQYGNWHGKGLGTSFQLQQPVLTNKYIDLTLPIEVSHIMRADTLQHIEQIGVVFMPAVEQQN